MFNFDNLIFILAQASKPLEVKIPDAFNDLIWKLAFFLGFLLVLGLFFEVVFLTLKKRRQRD